MKEIALISTKLLVILLPLLECVLRSSRIDMDVANFDMTRVAG